MHVKEKKKLSLAAQIFIALVLAVIAGLLMQKYANFAETYIKPFGTIFLNLLKFIVVPIVLFSIMCGIISMSDIKKVGSIGLKTVIFYLCTTAFAVTIGLTGGNLFKGLFPVVATTDLAYEAAEATSFMDTLVNIFPSNFISPMVEANMLQVIVMAIILGFAIILVGEKNVRVVNAFMFRKNPRQVLTRGQLLEKLWDIDERFVDEHTLTTSISRIRSKIEADGGAPYIKTVYGMGYQWTGGEAK